ncbi:GtrA family protein [Silanimonas sp.]|jgi:putative flippase GtrA|uniref:GtrA family protein n=1 Tax=Silanimonas sp. TaxID=1929290 RepID=UPI0022C7C166|nr:GtrA family protein [Silanimonas sp.]MCZ8165880.1 GtrA family protein [Silanimonas sp.]
MKGTIERCARWLQSGEGGRQLSGYALVGALQLLIDWGTYVGLTALGVPTLVANPGARAIGAMFGYVGNGAYTFRQAEGSHRLGRGSLARFVLLWLVLTAASTAALAVIDLAGGLRWAWVLKPVVDLGLAGLAFIASRLWVYR